jgi:hypothetical protein
MTKSLRNIMSDSATPHSRVLLLGAGFVVRPTLDVLADAGIEVTVGMSSVLRCEVELEY